MVRIAATLSCVMAMLMVGWVACRIVSRATNPQAKVLRVEEAGMVFFSSADGSSYLENNNEFPVRVQCISQGVHGEQTRWTRTIEPKDRHCFTHYSSYVYFVYRIDQRFFGETRVEIAFIKPR